MILTLKLLQEFMLRVRNPQVEDLLVEDLQKVLKERNLLEDRQKDNLLGLKQAVLLMELREVQESQLQL